MTKILYKALEIACYAVGGALGLMFLLAANYLFWVLDANWLPGR